MLLLPGEVLALSARAQWLRRDECHRMIQRLTALCACRLSLGNWLRGSDTGNICGANHLLIAVIQFNNQPAIGFEAFCNSFKRFLALGYPDSLSLAIRRTRTPLCSQITRRVHLEVSVLG